MTILCIETSTSVCSAAICKDGKPFKQCINKEGSSHARLLPLYIENLLDWAQTEGMKIEAVALSEGPGSYTGLRIGTSTAKGLCYGLDIPLIPVPTLEVLCEAARESISNHQSSITHHQSPITNPLLCPMIDARRMEVYTALYSAEVKGERLKVKGSQARAVVVENEENLYSRSDLEAVYTPSAQRSIYYFGDGAAKCRVVLTNPDWHYLPDIVPEAQYIGVLAENLMADGRILTASSIAYYEPYYLKEFVAAPSHIKGLN